MRPEEFEKPSPEVLAMVAAEKAVEAALASDSANTTLPEPALADTVQSSAVDPGKAAALALIHSLPGVKLPVGTPSAPAPAPRRRITVPIDTRAVSAERPSLAERVEVEKAVRRGWWISGLVLAGLAAVGTAFAVFAFGVFPSSKPEEEVFVRPPRLPKHQVVKQPVELDEDAPEDEAEELAPLVVSKPKAAKRQLARPGPAAKPQPKEKASDLKRPNMGPEASALPREAPAESAPKQRTVAAAARADTRHADEPADPPEDSNARLFDDR
jgi:hypothetical protein